MATTYLFLALCGLCVILVDIGIRSCEYYETRHAGLPPRQAPWNALDTVAFVCFIFLFAAIL